VVVGNGGRRSIERDRERRTPVRERDENSGGGWWWWINSETTMVMMKKEGK
jgi:hypothetical protein